MSERFETWSASDGCRSTPEDWAVPRLLDEAVRERVADGVIAA